MIKAVYPGTFDPLTRGHEDLVRRASRLFDSLVLGVAQSSAKKTYFTLDERIEIAREVRYALYRRRAETSVQPGTAGTLTPNPAGPAATSPISSEPTPSEPPANDRP